MVVCVCVSGVHDSIISLQPSNLMQMLNLQKHSRSFGGMPMDDPTLPAKRNKLAMENLGIAPQYPHTRYSGCLTIPVAAVRAQEGGIFQSQFRIASPAYADMDVEQWPSIAIAFRLMPIFVQTKGGGGMPLLDTIEDIEHQLQSQWDPYTHLWHDQWKVSDTPAAEHGETTDAADEAGDDTPATEEPTTDTTAPASPPLSIHVMRTASPNDSPPRLPVFLEKFLVASALNSPTSSRRGSIQIETRTNTPTSRRGSMQMTSESVIAAADPDEHKFQALSPHQLPAFLLQSSLSPRTSPIAMNETEIRTGQNNTNPSPISSSSGASLSLTAHQASGGLLTLDSGRANATVHSPPNTVRLASTPNSGSVAAPAASAAPSLIPSLKRAISVIEAQQVSWNELESPMAAPAKVTFAVLGEQGSRTSGTLDLQTILRRTGSSVRTADSTDTTESAASSTASARMSGGGASITAAFGSPAASANAARASLQRLISTPTAAAVSPPPVRERRIFERSFYPTLQVTAAGEGNTAAGNEEEDNAAEQLKQLIGEYSHVLSSTAANYPYVLPSPSCPATHAAAGASEGHNRRSTLPNNGSGPVDHTHGVHVRRETSVPAGVASPRVDGADTAGPRSPLLSPQAASSPQGDADSSDSDNAEDEEEENFFGYASAVARANI